MQNASLVPYHANTRGRAPRLSRLTNIIAEVEGFFHALSQAGSRKPNTRQSKTVHTAASRNKRISCL